METNPIVPRQRNRRAERQTTETPPTPVPQSVPIQPQPVQQAPVQPAPQQPVYSQTPLTMYQQQPQQPVRPAAANYPQMQGQYPQDGYRSPQARPVPPMTAQQAAPVQPIVPAQQASPSQPIAPAQQMRPAQPVQYAPRPRALNQPSTVNSGWQQPTVRTPAEVPHARASHSLTRETAKAEKAARRDAEAKARKAAQEKAAREAPSTEAKPEKKKLPGWLTTMVSLSLIGVMALIAIYYLMQAYLVTEENKRIAAYEAVLNNYHVTESADGTLHVTWQEHIEKYAAQYNLQPAFVTAIIRNESSFRTNAESSVGARGLMQLMPDTAEWIARKLDDPTYTFDRMWDAETNIRYGCWYLGYLSRLFRGDPVLVSAAYHAGQTTVTQWLSDPEKSDDGITINPDRLTDGPTKQYIGRVTQTYGIYQTLLYPNEAFGMADAVSAGSASSAAAER